MGTVTAAEPKYPTKRQVTGVWKAWRLTPDADLWEMAEAVGRSKTFVGDALARRGTAKLTLPELEKIAEIIRAHGGKVTI
jgi:hypothetical protein